jgi:hypothetical protein
VRLSKSKKTIRERATLGLVTHLAADPIEIALHMARKGDGRSLHPSRSTTRLTTPKVRQIQLGGSRRGATMSVGLHECTSNPNGCRQRPPSSVAVGGSSMLS